MRVQSSYPIRRGEVEMSSLEGGEGRVSRAGVAGLNLLPFGIFDVLFRHGGRALCNRIRAPRVLFHLRRAKVRHRRVEGVCADLLTCWMVRRFTGSSRIRLETRSRASAETFFHFSSGLKVKRPLTTYDGRG